MKNNTKPSYLDFDVRAYPWKPTIDYRKNPAQYKVGKGEQGVLICEPYKSEILPYWKFKTEELAHRSSQKIYAMFEDYLAQGDFVGADMARKFLQMGFTRSRRYTNYKGGVKYDKNNNYSLNERGTGDPEKALAAKVFYTVWKLAEANEEYACQKTSWRSSIG